MLWCGGIGTDNLSVMMIGRLRGQKGKRENSFIIFSQVYSILRLCVLLNGMMVKEYPQNVNDNRFILPQIVNSK